MRRNLLFPLLLPALLAGACAPPPEPRIDDLYRGLSENVPRLDPSLLAGRRIVIDPGHGGHFAGTRGQEGLEEASVNLGVSLYLWGLLREAGADAYLTRSAEKDFLAGPDSAASDDLKVRIAKIDSIQPDIVVSIHHNAEPERDPSRNAVETYYKIGDPASRDLASAVHRHLARNLGIAEGEVRPGNYYILREAKVPAILGEGSYLTHPKVEESLRLSEKQRLEAEAYFLGILDYFSRGTPVVRELGPAPDDSVVIEVPIVSFAVSDVGGVGIDPSGIEMSVNGAAVDAVLDTGGRRIVYRFPWNAPNGVYEVALAARNILGNSSRRHERTLLVTLPASRAVFDSYPKTVPTEGGKIHVRVRLLDRRGLSVADGSRVAVASWHRGGGESGKGSRGGGWIPMTPGGASAAEAVVSDGVAEFSINAPPGCAGVRASVLPAGHLGVDPDREGEFDEAGFSFVIPAGASGAVSRSLAVLDRRTGAPVSAARFSSDSTTVSADLYGDCFVLAGAAAAAELRVEAPGYRPGLADPNGPDTLYLEPWYGGALAGKRFVLNAEGAPPRALDRGPLGLSGSAVNLRVARYLEEYLTAAGARVRQARQTEETPTDRDVVLLTNRFRANLYVEIRYRGGPPEDDPAVRAYFFPGSGRGLAAATALGTALARAIGTAAAAPGDTVTFPLQQTACPAVIVQPPGLGRVEEELRLSESWYQRRQAYGIFGGILADAGVTGTASLRVELAPDAREAERANWLVTVDEAWCLVTSPEGGAVFDWLPPGPHQIVLRRAGTVIGPFDVVLESGESRTLTAGAAPTR
jgi:N-acetylmuramoyl-L-alanine amidase